MTNEKASRREEEEEAMKPTPEDEKRAREWLATADTHVPAESRLAALIAEVRQEEHNRVLACHDCIEYRMALQVDAKAANKAEVVSLREQLAQAQKERDSLELALVGLRNAAYSAERIVFDTYSNAQKLRWDEIEGNCREASRMIQEALKPAEALLAETEEGK